MKKVNIAELKNNLSSYLRKVKSGQEIIVSDRNQPVAKIIPWLEKSDDELASLSNSGKIKLAKA